MEVAPEPELEPEATVPAPPGRNGRVPHVVAAAYYDTESRSLAQNGLALRRSVENGVALWQLELPAGDGRLEVEQRGDRGEPPAALVGLLAAQLRHEALAPVPEQPPAPVPLGARATAGRGLRRFVAAQVREILANDPGTRLGTDPESLHRQRVAVRRLGSVLRAVHTLVELERVGTIRTELKLLGAVLGSVRDFDVIIGHLHEELLELRPADRAAAAPLLATLEHERRLTRTIMLADLTTARYFGLLDELERLVEELPELHGRRRLAGLARAEFERLEFAVAEAGPDPDDRTLHALRGRGKRARYAAELAGARAFAAKAKRFQDVLGRHQDAVVCEQRLRSLLESHPSVEAALVVGQLVERERAYRAVAHAQWPRAWKHVRRSGRATWS